MATLVMLAALSTKALLQVSGAAVKELTGRRGRGYGGGDDDNGDGGNEDPNREQKLDMGGLQDSLKTGGADGLVGMLSAMGAMHHDTQLIPTTKDADGNEMYNFGALGMTTPAPVVQVTVTQPPVTPAVEAVSTAPPAGVMVALPQAPAPKAAVTEHVAVVVATIPQAVAPVPAGKAIEQVESPILTKGLRGANAPQQVASEASVKPAMTQLPSVPSAAAPEETTSAQSLRQGLTAIRNNIDSLIKESDGMMSGSQVNLRTLTVEQSSASHSLQQQSQEQQQQWAEMLRRVGALEEEHARLQKQVSAQNDQIQGLESDEATEKQQLAVAVQENGVLRANATDVKQQLGALKQQSEQLQADEKQVKVQLGSVEQENKQLQGLVKTSTSSTAAHQAKATHQKTSSRHTTSAAHGHNKKKSKTELANDAERARHHALRKAILKKHKKSHSNKKKVSAAK
jgi:hypothetical protein